MLSITKSQKLIKRNKAFYLRKAKGKGFNVGISSTRHLFIDIDSDQFLDALKVAKDLMRITKDTVGVFQTKNGYWLTTKNPVKNQDSWIWGYIYLIEKYPDIIDVAHAEISLKYGKTTFRVSKQKGLVPVLVAKISPPNRMHRHQTQTVSQI